MNNKYHTVGTIAILNIKIVDRGKIDTLNIQIHVLSLSMNHIHNLPFGRDVTLCLSWLHRIYQYTAIVRYVSKSAAGYNTFETYIYWVCEANQIRNKYLVWNVFCMTWRNSQCATFCNMLSEHFAIRGIPPLKEVSLGCAVQIRYILRTGLKDCANHYT